MKLLALLTVAAVLLTPLYAFGDRDDDDRGRWGKRCSEARLAGAWLFATDVGSITIDPDFDPVTEMNGPLPPQPFDITAAGTMNIARDGNLYGTFTSTIKDFTRLDDVTYTGTVEVNSDCTGTLVFETSENSRRTDRILVLGPRLIRGMSLDPANLWTYEVYRAPVR